MKLDFKFKCRKQTGSGSCSEYTIEPLVSSFSEANNHFSVCSNWVWNNLSFFKYLSVRVWLRNPSILPVIPLFLCPVFTPDREWAQMCERTWQRRRVVPTAPVFGQPPPIPHWETACCLHADNQVSIHNPHGVTHPGFQGHTGCPLWNNLLRKV